MWKKVSVMGWPGTEFGVIEDTDGTLVITHRLPGQEWPHDVEPQKASLNKIELGYTRYTVLGDDDE